MALDHFISQVHLKNFYSPEMDGKKMFGMRKNVNGIFPCGSEDVCRIEDGSTNKYLLENRAIENFLSYVEPFYNRALNSARSGTLDQDDIFIISGFVSFVSACSPTAMRLFGEPLRNIVQITTELLERNGQLAPPPPSLSGRTLSELIKNGKINIDIDEKYPQAIGISSILDSTLVWGNSEWDILINEEKSSPFFTSDYPAAIEQSADPRVMNRLVPLAPDVCVRIKPNINIDRKKLEFSFDRFRHRTIKVKKRDIIDINRLIVQCAENFLFFRDNHPWVEKFIIRNSEYRIEPKSHKIRHGSGTLSIHSIGIVSTQSNSNKR